MAIARVMERASERCSQQHNPLKGGSMKRLDLHDELTLFCTFMAATDNYAYWAEFWFDEVVYN